MALKRFWIMFLPVCVLLVAVTGLADTIKLKNGSVIKGKVTSYGDREFTVLLDLGSTTKRSSSRMVISVDDIDTIQFDIESIPPVMQEAPAGRSTPQTSTPTSAPIRAVDSNAPTLAEKTVSVIAAADWTSTEIKVLKGQRISITASGQVGLGGSRRSGPEGIVQADPDKLLQNNTTGSLIAVIGDDNNEFIPIGAAGEFVAQRDGILFLSINEGNLRDNSGSFSARVRVFAR